MNYLETLFICILILFITACSNSESDQTTKSNQSSSQSTISETVGLRDVSISDLNDAIQSKNDFLILDVRTPEEVALGRIPNSKNIDVHDSSFIEVAAKLDPTQTVYVYCKSGKRSAIASEKLSKLGFTDIRNVTGGFLDWKSAGYELTK